MKERKERNTIHNTGEGKARGDGDAKGISTQSIVGGIVAVLVIAGAVAVGMGLLPASSSYANLPDVVAMVNGEEIRKEDFLARISQFENAVSAQGNEEQLKNEDFIEGLYNQTLE